MSRHFPRKRGIQYAAAFRFYHRRLWNTGSPAFAGDDSGGCGARAARGTNFNFNFSNSMHSQPNTVFAISPLLRGRFALVATHFRGLQAILLRVLLMLVNISPISFRIESSFVKFSKT